MKKADPRLMLVVAMTVFGTLGLFVRNISVSSGELALYRAADRRILTCQQAEDPLRAHQKGGAAAASLRCGDGRQLDPFI